MSKPLIIFGNGGLASVLRYYSESIGLSVAGYTLDKEFHTSDSFEGLPNYCFEELPKHLDPVNFQLFIAIGASDMLGFARQEKMMQGLQMGFDLFSHSFASNSPADKLVCGRNSLVMPSSSIDPFVVLGDGVVVWNGSTICHHTTVGDFSFIAPGATICGKVQISEHCFIGSNATIRDNIVLAPRTLVGAGATITKNTEVDSVYMPGRTVRLDRSSSELHFKY